MARNLGRLKETARAIGEGCGGRDHACALDITDEESVKAACRMVTNTAGRIDILVNNPGCRAEQQTAGRGNPRGMEQYPGDKPDGNVT